LIREIKSTRKLIHLRYFPEKKCKNILENAGI